MEGFTRRSCAVSTRVLLLQLAGFRMFRGTLFLMAPPKSIHSIGYESARYLYTHTHVCIMSVHIPMKRFYPAQWTTIVDKLCAYCILVL